MSDCITSQTTDDNIIRRMRVVCWIKRLQTHTQNTYYLLLSIEKVVIRTRLNVTFILLLFRIKSIPCIIKYIETDLYLCAVPHFTVHLFQTKNLRHSVLWVLYVLFINLTVINMHWQYIKSQVGQKSHINIIYKFKNWVLTVLRYGLIYPWRTSDSYYICEEF